MPDVAVAHSGAENMALDAAMLRAAQAGRALFRVYQWSPPCLSFGRNEPARTRYDRVRIEELGLDTVRRPTGGRAVWHDQEVTYALAAPVSLFGSLTESYLRIHQMIARALHRMGVPAQVASSLISPPSSLTAGACFASPASGEVIVHGRKLVGSAQTREGTAFLQHGSILLGDGQDLVTQVTRGAAALPAATSLSRVLGKPVEFNDVADVLEREARDLWGVDATWHGFMGLPDTALVSRFSDPAWTWRR